MKNLSCVKNTPLLSTVIQPAAAGTVALFANAPDGAPWLEVVLAWKVETFGASMRESFVVVTPIGVVGELDGAHSIAHPNGVIECARSIDGRRLSIAGALSLAAQTPSETSANSSLGAVARRFTAILDDERKAGEVVPNKLASVETTYKRHTFRSPVKARWAVFFDALGITWKCKPHGFDMGDGLRYAPDFWLPFLRADWGYWVEVTTDVPTSQAVERMRQLTRLSGHHGYFLCGQPGDGEILRLDYSGVGPSKGTLPGFVSLFAEGKVDAAVHAARAARFEFDDSGTHA